MRMLYVFAVLICVCLVGVRGKQAGTPRELTPDLARSTVFSVADVVEREYFDPAAARSIADALRRRAAEVTFRDPSLEALAAVLSRELLALSSDKHLAVGVIRSASIVDPVPPVSRSEQVRRANGGVQRVEILDGNVGYLNLTAFWRLDEARDAIDEAMRLLSRADALIIDMRNNGGGSPETVAHLLGYLLDGDGVRLFTITPRYGEPVSYEAPTGLGISNRRRPLFVLTSASTFSAGEGLAFLLQQRQRAQVVGERTAGAANPGRPYPVNELFQVTVPNGRLGSAIDGRNWEGTGVIPDVAVAAEEALAAAHARARTVLRRY